MKTHALIVLLAVIFSFFLLSSVFRPLSSTLCSRTQSKELVIYTSVDQNFSEPFLRLYETRTGVAVKPVYDVEATKTVGLANRLAAEKNRPQADVFWNGEIIQTLILKQKGVVTSCSSLGGRGRILLVNTNLVQGGMPSSLMDLVSDKWPADKIAIGHPLFGTSLTHAGALYAVLGAEKAKAFYQQVKERKIRVVDGNSVVRDLVASG